MQYFVSIKLTLSRKLLYTTKFILQDVIFIKAALAALLAYLLNKYRLLPQDLIITILNEYGFSLDLPRQIGNNKQE